MAKDVPQVQIDGLSPGPKEKNGGAPQDVRLAQPAGLLSGMGATAGRHAQDNSYFGQM